QTIANSNVENAEAKPFDKVVGKRFFHQHPAQGGAPLPTTQKGRCHDLAGSFIEVVTVEHDGRILAAEFQLNLDHPLRRALVDPRAHSRGAGKTDATDSRVGYQAISDSPARANNKVQNSSRQTSFLSQLGNVHGGPRRQGSRLQYHGIAASKRGHNLAHGSNHGKVPRGNRGYHTYRFKNRVTGNHGPFAGEGISAQAQRFSRRKASFGGSARNFAGGLLKRFALLQGDNSCELVLGIRQQLRETN